MERDGTSLRVQDLPPVRKLRVRLEATCLLLSAVLAGAVGAPINFTVDATRGYSINGHPTIQRNVFGLSAYEGAPIPATPEGRELLRRAGITCLGFPGVIGWCAPESLPADGMLGVLRWYESEDAVRMIRDRRLDGDRYMYGKILPGCREISIEPMIYLLGGPQWALGEENIPRDPEQYAALVAAYVKLLRKFDPKLRLFHLDNEPNAHWYKVNKGGADYAKLFVTVAKALKAAVPDALLGGPVICWPPAWPPAQTGQRNWYTWEGWTLPLLDIAGEHLDFFDFHIYGFTTDQALEEVTTLEVELRHRRGREVPILITESGLGLTKEDWHDPAAHWQKRTLPWARYLLALLEHPDKVHSNQMHDLSAVAGEWFRFANWEDKEEQTPTFWLYRLLRHTRGHRLAVNAPPVPGLTAFATVGEGAATTFLFNDTDDGRGIRVRFTNLPEAVPARWERIFLQPDNRFVHDEGEGATVQLPPRGLAAVWAPVNELPPRVAAERLEFFGAPTMQDFPAEGGEVAVTASLPAQALKGATSARVRVGTLGNAPGEKLAMVVGKQMYPLATGTYFQEVQLRSLPLAGELRLVFRCASPPELVAARPGDHRLRLSSATLVIEREVRPRPRRISLVPQDDMA